MKKALVITYYWPPSGGAGVQRWLKFVKYLRFFGWEPVIYTPSNPEYPELDSSLEKDVPEGVEVIRYPIWEPYSFYKRVSGKRKEEKIQAAFLSEKKVNPLAEKGSVWIRGNLFIPDARMFWIRPSVRFLKKKLTGYDIDLVISSGPPHSMHLIAMKVAGFLGKPWLADFRDPWTGIDFYEDLALTRYADRRHRRLELGVLRTATAVTVISPTMATDLERIHPRKYEVITNGYDPDDMAGPGMAQPDDKFSIAYIGTLTASRNLKVIWSALSQLISENEDFRNDLRIRLVGKVDYTATETIRSFGLEDFVIRTGYLPHEEVVKVQRNAGVLLLLINDTPNARCILPGKFFEYMASRRPILCIGPGDGDAAKILQGTGAGLNSGYDDIGGTKSNILSLYHLFKEGRLAVPGGEIGSFSMKVLAGKMAELMDSITG